MSYEQKYDKDILAEETINVDGDDYTCYILDDKDYYNVHVVDDHYHDDEGNTLRLQEPKECVSLDKVTSKPFMLSQIMEHVLWHMCYGENRKMYDFSIDYEENDLNY